MPEFSVLIERTQYKTVTVTADDHEDAVRKVDAVAEAFNPNGWVNDTAVIPYTKEKLTGIGYLHDNPLVKHYIRKSNAPVAT